MERGLVAGRHRSLANGPCCLIGFLRDVPLGEVQFLSSLIHMLLDEPRDRSYVRVPRPHRLIAVAIEARSHREIPSNGGIPRWFCDDGGVRMVPPIRNNLDDDEEKKKSDQDSFDPSHRSCHTVSFA